MKIFLGPLNELLLTLLDVIINVRLVDVIYISREGTSAPLQ
jgi:hypothetical protein